VSARTQTVEGLRRKVDALKAKLAAQETAWTRGGVDAWRAHVATKTHRRAIEATARRWGRMIGPTYVELCAARLVCVDEQPDGTRLTDESALGLVERWASEGPRARTTTRRAA
jgi:hypothetical protein